jgi:hypothetical protein
MADAIFNRDNEVRLSDISAQVSTMLADHPLYPEL